MSWLWDIVYAILTLLVLGPLAFFAGLLVIAGVAIAFALIFILIIDWIERRQA